MIERISELVNNITEGSLKDIDTTPPEGVVKEAKRVLAWKDKYGKEVKGGTRVGWTRANQLAKGEKLSLNTVKRMYSFFSRHEGNQEVPSELKSTPWKDSGKVAWLLWGGDAGFRWSKKIVSMINRLEDK